MSRFLATRDESAFAELVTRYSRLVMSVAVHTLRDRHAADDAFQATFLVLARNARRIRNRDSLASWLHGTTFRVSRRLLRSQLRRKEQDLPSVELAAFEGASGAPPDQQAALDEELARLSEGLRAPLVLHYLEGRTVREIAAELRMTASAVEGRLKRGKETLRKRLLKRGVLLSSALQGAALLAPAESAAATALVSSTVAACLATSTGAALAPVAGSTIQLLALKETAAMARIALMKSALAWVGAAGAVGLAGAGMNGSLGSALAGGAENGPVAAAGDGGSAAGGEADPAPRSFQSTVTQVAGEKPAVQIQGPDGSRLEAGSVFLDLSIPPGSQRAEMRVVAEHALRRPAAVTAEGVGLSKLTDSLSGEIGVPIHLEVDPSAKVKQYSISAKGIRLSSILDSIVADIPGGEYAWFVADDGIHIGPKSAQAAGANQDAMTGFGTFMRVYDEAGMPGGGMGGGLGPGGTPKAAGAGMAPGGFGGALPGMAPMPGGGGGAMGMGGMSGMPGMGGMSAGGEGGLAANTPGTARPANVDQILKKMDQASATALRAYLSRLEGARSEAGVGTMTSGALQSFRKPATPGEKQIETSLEQVVDLNINGATLKDVASMLSEQHHIPIRLDETELANAGVGPEQVIQFAMKGISLNSALGLMLRDVSGAKLDYVIENEVLTITTREKADQQMQTVVYDVTAISGTPAEQIVPVIEQAVEPQSWNISGGQGTIQSINGALVVTTNRRLHEKTSELLDLLIKHAEQNRKRSPGGFGMGMGSGEMHGGGLSN